MIPTISKFQTNSEFIKASTEFIIKEALTAITEKNTFTIMLSGGSTPKAIYNLLNSSEYKEEFPWEKTYFLLGDERLLSHNDPDSNISMLHQSLFLNNIVDKNNKILPEITTTSAEISARRYEQKINNFFKDQEITIDLTLLGIGTDGHTASLFPKEYNNWINNNNLIINTSDPCGNPSINRISASLKLLNRSNTILLLATGEKKITILNKILEDIKNQTNQLHSPLAEIKPLKVYHWLIN